jgi:hypothetical protein
MEVQLKSIVKDLPPLFGAFYTSPRLLFTPHFLSIPIIIARSDLVTTVPHAVAIYFTRMSRDLAFAMPPFDIARFDVQQQLRRRSDEVQA